MTAVMKNFIYEKQPSCEIRHLVILNFCHLRFLMICLPSFFDALSLMKRLLHIEALKI